MIKRLIYLTILLLSSLSVQAQSESFRELYDQLPGQNKYFFYPSTLRALSGGNEQFLEFVKDIKNLKLLVLNPEDEIYKNLKVDQFQDAIKAEGFAELMTIKEDNSLITIMENDESMLAMLNAKDNVAMIEIVGSINIAAAMRMLKEGELPIAEFEKFFKKENKKKNKPQKQSNK